MNLTRETSGGQCYARTGRFSCRCVGRRVALIDAFVLLFSLLILSSFLFLSKNYCFYGGDSIKREFILFVGSSNVAIRSIIVLSVFVLLSVCLMASLFLH